MNAQACRDLLNLAFASIKSEAVFIYSDNTEAYSVANDSINALGDAEAMEWVAKIASGDCVLDYTVTGETIFPCLR